MVRPGTANPLFAGSIPARASIPLNTDIQCFWIAFLGQSDNKSDNKFKDVYTYPVVFTYVHWGAGVQKSDRMITLDRLGLAKKF